MEIILQIENEYYEKKKKDEENISRYSKLNDDERPKITNEEIDAILKFENDSLNKRSVKKTKTFKQRAQSSRGVRRVGHNEKPLDRDDERHVKKYANYLMKKKVNQSGEDFKEDLNDEWNTTKIKSQNYRGEVNRPDKLPGHIDREDYSMYYVSISSNHTPKSLSIKSLTRGDNLTLFKK